MNKINSPLVLACEQAPKEIGERSEPRRAWGRIKIGGACRQRFYAAVPSTRRAPDPGATYDWPDCWLLTGLIDILICRRHETRYDQNFHVGSAKCKHDGVFWRWASYRWSVLKSIKRFIKGIRRHKRAERKAETLLAISGVVETRWQAYTDPYIREVTHLPSCIGFSRPTYFASHLFIKGTICCQLYIIRRRLTVLSWVEPRDCSAKCVEVIGLHGFPPEDVLLSSRMTYLFLSSCCCGIFIDAWISPPKYGVFNVFLACFMGKCKCPAINFCLCVRRFIRSDAIIPGRRCYSFQVNDRLMTG